MSGATGSHQLLRRFDLTTLHLFVAICEEGALTKAAQRESIAPSAVSKRLAELERDLGIELLVRGPRGMTTTPAGETLLHHARQMIFKADQIAVELAEHVKGGRGFVRMLANLSAIVQFLPTDLRAFFARETTITLDLEERPSTGVVQGVADGWAEIGICAGSVDVRGLCSRLYRRDELAVVVPPDHPLADRPAVAFADTLDFDHVGLHAESSIYAQVRAAAQRINRNLRLRVHAPGFDAVCRMAQAGMGVGIVPRLVIDLFGASMGLVGLPLTDGWAQRELRLVTRAGPLSPASELLTRHLLAGAP